MTEANATQLAKLALRRLAQSKQEPTPENYARAYAAEAGSEPPEPALGERAQAALLRVVQLGVGDATERQQLLQALQQARWADLQRHAERLLSSDGPAAQGEALALGIDQLVRGLERGGKLWTLARKKDGLARVLAANKGDSARLARRLRQLVGSWDSDAEAGVEARGESDGGTPSGFFSDTEAIADPLISSQEPAHAVGEAAQHWPLVAADLHETVQAALRPPNGDANADRVALLAQQLRDELRSAQNNAADTEHAEAISSLCEQARRLLAHRHYLLNQLGGLCEELSHSLVELSEDDSWAQGQAAVMHDALAQGLNPLAVRGVQERLAHTRTRQRVLRQERHAARDSLKSLVESLLLELGQLGTHTDRFTEHLDRYAEVVGHADSLDSLAGLVREMVEESRAVQGIVKGSQQRLASEHTRASELAERVNTLEDELKRLAEEVQTDQLTKVANRRGLQTSFLGEQARMQREGGQLAVALLDIDNFKKLNDSLGHAAGDEALIGLANKTQAILRPGDVVARYGGEEFVLLLPSTELEEARQVIGRLQRALSSSLFMHDGKDVFITFSAGVTLYRTNESLEAALTRADEALYEAKRTGKNRTCTA
jgi:diguanylate cyclase